MGTLQIHPYQSKYQWQTSYQSKRGTRQRVPPPGGVPFFDGHAQKSGVYDERVS